MTTNGTIPPPIAIGGVGGSGTRIVADLVRSVGVRTGTYLNHASDTLWFTLLFKREEILATPDDDFGMLVRVLASALSGGDPITARDRASLLSLAAHPRPHHPVPQLRTSLETLLESASQPRHDDPWGWKEPNTHMVIERIWRCLPDLRYVHVVRNGIDMAFSGNQNQLELWGKHVLGDAGGRTPARSLSFWCKVQRRMESVLAENGRRMYWLDYDALCREPQAEWRKLCEFLGLDPASPATTAMLGQVHRPAPRQGVDLSLLDAADVEFARSLGYAA